MFTVISNTSVRKYNTAREVAKDLYFREKRAKKTSMPFNEGIKFYLGFIGENLRPCGGAFDVIAGGKKINIRYE